MTEIKQRLMAMIDNKESVDVEFKSGRGGLPASLWSTYSAFANTNGGTIVLGVQEKSGRYMRVYHPMQLGRNGTEVSEGFLG